MLKVTQNAKNKIETLIKEDPEKNKNFLIRVAVESGGCSGLSYKLSFDNKSEENDKIFEDQGIKIAVDKRSFLYLVGTTLDYSDGLNGKGFAFINPNASRTCGCGESFAV